VGAPTPRLLALARPLTPLHEAAYRFTAYLSELERRVRRSAQGSPSELTRREMSDKLTALLTSFARAEEGWSRGDLDLPKRDVREILGPWFWRSEIWSRAFYKPHGYAGDFGLFDRLEAVKNDDALKPGIVACLDHAFADLDVARAICERRSLLSSMLLRERFRKRAPLSILDLAPRGARHLADYVGALRNASDEKITIADDDTAALAYTERVALAPWKTNVRTIAAPIHRVRSAILNERHDVIIISSQLDLADDDAVREDLASLASCLAKGGLLIAANLHSDERSRAAREWLLDWPCYTRDERSLLALMPENAEVSRSPDGVLSIATLRNINGGV
jgi:extracellular factor (EF) 3-hydroxypalmitic acid methyl ester biosynthesis protein